ncbi:MULTISPECIES: SufB/SufD family protein [unclassified Yoonia]|uniref:SufB/SufD family protein n=1 Tax=unclassified Yoonia TaxID=2629118 RepID=UPI002AFF5E7B|nr:MULTISPECIES: SufD family Fe-S cluster assembly protein [unclassified Yoonia]
MAVAQLKLDTTTNRLAAVTLPDGAVWAQAARSDALARVSAMGLPTRRDEYWRYTDPASLVAVDAPAAALFDNGEGPLFAGLDKIALVFVDGVFDASQSDDLTGVGLEIDHLSTATQADIHWATDLYGKLEERGQHPVPRPLAALNTAIATDGIVIRATAAVTKPVHITYLHQSTTSDVTLHHVVRVEEGASLTLLETGPGAARLNTCLEVDIANTGQFHHIRAQGNDHERRAVTHCFAQLGTESVFKSFTLTFNGVLTRNECVIDIRGDDAIAHVAGACVGDGDDFHHDDTVFVTHDALRGESRQVFKKVLRNGAVGVFQGKILVKQGAQKTDGYQISQSLLLDDDSQFLAKPELEIYADDVACSHGSTTGAIDETALFYLRSRGVPLHTARNLLTLSFLAEALAEIEDEALAEELQTRLEGWLARRA